MLNIDCQWPVVIASCVSPKFISIYCKEVFNRPALLQHAIPQGFQMEREKNEHQDGDNSSDTSDVLDNSDISDASDGGSFK
jgi:hypothetical protein